MKVLGVFVKHQGKPERGLGQHCEPSTMKTATNSALRRMRCMHTHTHTPTQREREGDTSFFLESVHVRQKTTSKSAAAVFPQLAVDLTLRDLPHDPHRFAAQATTTGADALCELVERLEA